jgi:rhodanese-related sulfurtransferase
MKAKIPGALLMMFTALGVQTKAQTVLKVNDFANAVKDGNVQLLDVRRPDEYKEGHLPRAVNANWQDDDQFKQEVARLDKHKPVYLYCLSGVRSARAADWLTANGFAQVIGLDGGIKAWNAAGKPLAKPGEKAAEGDCNN